MLWTAHFQKIKSTSQLPFSNLRSLFPAHLSSLTFKASCRDWLIPSFPTASRTCAPPVMVHLHLKQPSYLCPTFYSPFRSSPNAASSMKSPCLSADSCSSLSSSACSLSFTRPDLTAAQCTSPCFGHDLFGSVER